MLKRAFCGKKARLTACAAGHLERKRLAYSELARDAPYKMEYPITGRGFASSTKTYTTIDSSAEGVLHIIVDSYQNDPPGPGNYSGSIELYRGLISDFDWTRKEGDESTVSLSRSGPNSMTWSCYLDNDGSSHGGGVVEFDVFWEPVNIIKTDMTAYRPQNIVVNYRVDLPRRAVPDDEEESPGAGIRINGSYNNKNLIEVELDAEPSGVSYFLKRANSHIKVWGDAAKTIAVLDANDEKDLTSSTFPLTIWVEYVPPTLPGGATPGSLLSLEARDSSGTVVCSDDVNFYPFKSVVIGLSGAVNPFPGLGPYPPEMNGMMSVSESLYFQGYDVHYFDEDAVEWDGSGEAYDVVDDVINYHEVTDIAIYGHSYGGGSTYSLAHQLSLFGGSASVGFASYVDAIKNQGVTTAAEDRYPTSAGLCLNLYQTYDGGTLGLFGTSVSGAANINVTLQPWGSSLSHTTIDDSANVQDGIVQQLMLQVDP